MKVSEQDVEDLRAGKKAVLLVSPVEGEEFQVWVDRRGDVHLTQAPKRSTIIIQDATADRDSP